MCRDPENGSVCRAAVIDCWLRAINHCHEGHFCSGYFFSGVYILNYNVVSEHSTHVYGLYSYFKLITL